MSARQFIRLRTTEFGGAAKVAFLEQHAAACRAVGRIVLGNGKATPDDAELAQHTYRNGYPSFGVRS